MKEQKDLAFAMLIDDPQSIPEAQRAVDSLRKFGGATGQSPVIVFHGEPGYAGKSSQEIHGDEVENVALEADDRVRGYLFAQKVTASAQAERWLSGRFQSMAWFETFTLVFNPPDFLRLDDAHDCAVRPVHVQNVGLSAGGSLDAYWNTIYRAVGVADVAQTSVSFLEGKQLRGYYNCGVYSIRLKTGILAQWLEVFARLVNDSVFQAGACRDELHQVYLHQAVLSALIAARVDPARMVHLPAEYGYPLHLQNELPVERRARTLGELVCPLWPEGYLEPGQELEIPSDDPLRGWLAV